MISFALFGLPQRLTKQGAVSGARVRDATRGHAPSWPRAKTVLPQQHLKQHGNPVVIAAVVILCATGSVVSAGHRSLCTGSLSSPVGISEVQTFQDLWRHHGYFTLEGDLHDDIEVLHSGGLKFSGNSGFGTFNPLDYGHLARFFSFDYDAAKHANDSNTNFTHGRCKKKDIAGYFERPDVHYSSNQICRSGYTSRHDVQNWQAFRTLPITSSQPLSLEMKLYIDDALFCMEIHEDGTRYNDTNMRKDSVHLSHRVTWNTHSGTFVLSCILFENGYGNIGFGVYDSSWNVKCGCDAGRYRSVGEGVCNICGEGKFNEKSGFLACANCPAGWHNASDHRACSACIPGKYANTEASGCLKCMAGRFSNTTARINGACEECPAGWSTLNESKALRCVECPRGRFSGSDQKECDECPKGRYTNEMGGSILVQACKACDRGFFSDLLAAVAPCEGKCPRGKYLPSPPSEFFISDADRDGLEDCLPCEPGKFSNVEGQDSCFGCPGAKRGSTSCSGCPPGRYVTP